MGNPLYSDNVGKMCFNSAKSWFLGWYSDAYANFDPSSELEWKGRIIGIAEWANGKNALPVSVRIKAK